MLNRRKGFTLVELLVVISIIALLIGILLPGLGEARRQGRLLVDLTNLKEHGTAAATFSATEKGRMPNGPEGNAPPVRGPNQANTGKPGKPARFFANSTGEYPWNGWGDPLIENGLLSGFIDHTDVWKIYNLAFGHYLIEGGTGLQLLADIFASPGQQIGGGVPVRDNYDTLKGEIQRFRWGAGGEFVNDQVVPRSPYFGAGGDSLAFALSPSYRYTVAGMYSKNEVDNSDFYGGIPGMFGQQGGRTAWNEMNWTNWRAYIQASEMAFPSNKVMFWEFWASNSRRADAYNWPNAETPAVMVDGHARITRPFEEMPDPTTQEYRERITNGEHIGTRQEITWADSPATFVADENFGGIPAVAWFCYTQGGPKGRDF